MLRSLVVLALSSLCTALNVGKFLTSLERLNYQADREKEGIIRRAIQQVNGDPLAALIEKSEFALSRGSAIAITGASDGLGLEAAVLCAKCGYAPIVCARSAEKADAAAQCVRDQCSTARVATAVIDLADFRSCEAGADAIRAAAISLDAPLRGLLLNAGVWPTKRRITVDGLEEGLQVCHVSHFMLCNALLPDLAAPSEEARIITVSSSAHALAPGVDTDDTSWDSREWDSTVAYGESKVANLLFAQELAERWPRTMSQRLTSLAVHPGVVTTSLFREFGVGGIRGVPAAPTEKTLQSLSSAVLEAPPTKLLIKSPKEGCRTLVHALLAPDLPTGSYLSDQTLTDVSPGAAKDARTRKQLWEWTEAWVQRTRAQVGGKTDVVANESAVTDVGNAKAISSAGKGVGAASATLDMATAPVEAAVEADEADGGLEVELEASSLGEAEKAEADEGLKEES